MFAGLVGRSASSIAVEMTIDSLRKRRNNMNLKQKAENWLLNVLLGKIVSRGAALLAGLIMGPVVQGYAAQAGIDLHVDTVKLTGGLMIGANIAFEWFKAKRMANPLSPAVQTDPAKIPAPVEPVKP